MNAQRSTTKTIIATLLLLGIAVGGGGICLFQSWKITRQVALVTANRDFLSEALPDATNRYHQKHVVFPDSVERFRFDGADEKLVEELVQRYELKPAQEPAEKQILTYESRNNLLENARFFKDDGQILRNKAEKTEPVTTGNAGSRPGPRLSPSGSEKPLRTTNATESTVRRPLIFQQERTCE
ncbi:MAG: hypothetical protein OSA98_14840 [Rubripirellula sp.]|nr:hypothetical protein [Rubripirellula sp.]